MRRMIRKKQIERLLALGYAEAAGMERKSFAKLIPLPENKANPIIVIPSNLIPIWEQMELIEVDGKHGKKMLLAESIRDVIETSDVPYWIYEVEDGGKLLEYKFPEEWVKIFGENNRRALTVMEGIALIAQLPKTLKDNNFVKLLGSRYFAGHPYLGLSLEDSVPELDAVQRSKYCSKAASCAQ